jgi:hypothetical protein
VLINVVEFKATLQSAAKNSNIITLIGRKKLMNLTKKLVIPTLALSFASHLAYSDCSNPVLSNPTYDSNNNTINLPLVKVLNDPNEQLDFVNATLQDD